MLLVEKIGDYFLKFICFLSIVSSIYYFFEESAFALWLSSVSALILIAFLWLLLLCSAIFFESNTIIELEVDPLKTFFSVTALFLPLIALIFFNN